MVCGTTWCPDCKHAKRFFAEQGVPYVNIDIEQDAEALAGITQTLDNFPGFDEGIAGAEFADRLGRQARRSGVETLQAQDVIDIELDGPCLCVTTRDGSQYGSKAVLLATGAHYRRLKCVVNNQFNSLWRSKTTGGADQPNA